MPAVRLPAAGHPTALIAEEGGPRQDIRDPPRAGKHGMPQGAMAKRGQSRRVGTTDVLRDRREDGEGTLPGPRQGLGRAFGGDLR